MRHDRSRNPFAAKRTLAFPTRPEAQDTRGGGAGPNAPFSRAWRRPAPAGLASLAGLMMLAGCVERTMTINTDPQGARVVINDEEVGLSPAKVSFLWYGNYDIMLRKRGYETLKTSYRIDAPWYQIPPIDLVAETMIIGTIHDDHTLPTFTLTPAESPPVEQLVERAVDLQEQALFDDSRS